MKRKRKGTLKAAVLQDPKQRGKENHLRDGLRGEAISSELSVGSSLFFKEVCLLR